MRPTDSFNRIPRVPPSETNVPSADKLWKRKKRERESHSRSARYLPRLVNTLAVNSLNKLFPVREERPLCRGELESWKKNTRSNLCFENPCYLHSYPPIVPNDSSLWKEAQRWITLLFRPILLDFSALTVSITNWIVKLIKIDYCWWCGTAKEPREGDDKCR